MAAIFENKKIECTEGNRMKFPRDSNWANLPNDCRNLCSGQRATLLVKGDQGAERTLTIENEHGKIYLTGGWREFREENNIRDGDKISFYEEDNSFGSGAQYRIKKL